MKKAQKANANLVVSLFYVSEMLPMLISGVCLYLGYKLFILGVTGQASICVEAETISGQLLNAAPGLFLAAGGIGSLFLSIIKGGINKMYDGSGDIDDKNTTPTIKRIHKW